MDARSVLANGAYWVTLYTEVAVHVRSSQSDVEGAGTARVRLVELKLFQHTSLPLCDEGLTVPILFKQSLNFRREIGENPI